MESLLVSCLCVSCSSSPSRVPHLSYDPRSHTFNQRLALPAIALFLSLSLSSLPPPFRVYHTHASRPSSREGKIREYNSKFWVGKRKGARTRRTSATSICIAYIERSDRGRRAWRLCRLSVSVRKGGAVWNVWRGKRHRGTRKAERVVRTVCREKMRNLGG